MNDKNEIDIRGSINNAISETSKDLLGMLVVAMIFGFAFAPCFSPFFRSYLEKKYQVNMDSSPFSPPGRPRMNLVNSEMKKINRNLWIVAIVSWILILAAFVAYN